MRNWRKGTTKMRKVELKENERIDDLDCANLQIIQNKNFFCFGIDSVLLANFAKDIRHHSIVMDLGTGNGILPILLSAKTKAKHIIGVEVQEELVELANRNILLNELENTIQIMHSNVKNVDNIIEKNSIDVIITNPPYKPLHTGLQNENKQKLIARHEIEANLEDFIYTSYKMLKDKGTLYMVHRIERLPDILVALRKYKIEPKEMQFVQNTKKEPPKLVLIKAVKNAHAFLKVKPILYIREENGQESYQIQEIRRGGE